MTWPVAIVLLGAMSVTAFLIGYLVHAFVYYRLEYEPEPAPRPLTNVDDRRQESNVDEAPGRG